MSSEKKTFKTSASFEHTSGRPYFAIILILTLFVPILFLPNTVTNAFNSPKSLLILLGVALMIAIHCLRILLGNARPKTEAPTHNILIFIVFLNFCSFLYTSNYYFTIEAAMMNISCLLLFHFLSLYADGRKVFWLIIMVAFSGSLVSLVTYLQFSGHYLWIQSVTTIIGTIGNSNYLGAYLLFPLFAMAGLIFLLKGKRRLIPLGLFIFMFGAFLFSRARAGWLGFCLSFPVFLIFMARIDRFSLTGYLRNNLKRFFISAVVLAAVLVSLWNFVPKRFHTMMDFRTITKSDTLKLRINKYSRSSLWLIKKNPIFGTGLWSYRNLVYDAQAEINQKDPNYFEDYPEPKPRRVHNDYLEILNDGGMVAAAALLLFFVLIMKHGWSVIRSERSDRQDRVIAATAFSSLIAIMLTAFFFFPFRVNTTLFMTVLMMGIMESIYLRHSGLISTCRDRNRLQGKWLFFLILLSLTGVAWYAGIRPFKGEIEHFKYEKALMQWKIKDAEKHILKAIEYDPHNTVYCSKAAQLYLNALKDFGKANDYVERAIIDFNGDLTRWSTFHIKGLLKFRMGSLFEARDAFEKALYYNPKFEPAKRQLAEVNEVVKNHDRVLIKFR